MERLAHDPATTSLPVVVCSAAITELGARSDELAAQGIGVVLKPFDLDDLLSAVRRGLRPARHRHRWDGSPPAT